MLILEWFVFSYVVLTILSVMFFTFCFTIVYQKDDMLKEIEKEINYSFSFPMVLFSLVVSIFIWPYIWYKLVGRWKSNK